MNWIKLSIELLPLVLALGCVVYFQLKRIKRVKKLRKELEELDAEFTRIINDRYYGQPCCDNEQRTMSGGCKNCDDPSL